MDAFPTLTTDLDTWMQNAEPGERMLHAPLPGGLVSHSVIAVRTHASRLVAFLPGASGHKSKRVVPFFNRWQWQGEIPDAHVIALADPALGVNDRIIGGWFMHADVDLIAELAAIVRRIADRLGVRHEDVTFYGSSLGGYGAVGMAAHLPGASAISEIPQIDVALWPVPSSQRLLEELVGQPLAEFRKTHPERVSLLDRLRFTGVIPPFTLITNLTDRSYDLQVQFIEQLPTLTGCDVIGEQRLVVTDVTEGHSALPKPVALGYLNATGILQGTRD